MIENSGAIAQILKQAALFNAIADEILLEIASELTSKSLAAEQVLFQEGDAGSALYLIASGKIKIFTRNALDEVTVLQQFGPGDYFGEVSLIDQRPRSASAMAVEQTELLVLKREAFLHVMVRHPALALDMMRDITARLRTTTAYVHKTNQSTATTVHAEAGNVQQQGRVFVSYSRKDVEFVRQLYQGLVQSGIAAWVDWKGIPPAADWWAEIEEAIRTADAFLFIITPDSLLSEICQREIATALNCNKRFLPILHRDITHEHAIPTAIARHNWIFMRTLGEIAPCLPNLVQTINTDLDRVHLHTRLLARAIEWERSGRDGSFTLRGVELERAARWLAELEPSAEPQPTRLHREYICAAQTLTRLRSPVQSLGVAG